MLPWVSGACVIAGPDFQVRGSSWVCAGQLIGGVQARRKSTSRREQEPGGLPLFSEFPYAQLDFPYSQLAFLYARLDVPYSRVEFPYSHLVSPYSHLDFLYSQLDVHYAWVEH